MDSTIPEDGDRSRVRRPELPRHEPIRSWTHLFGGAAPPRPGAPDTGLDAIARGVELGYRVIDDYLRQGQETAQRLREGQYGPRALAGDVEQLTGRLVRYGTELATVWLELLGTLATSGGLAGLTPASWAGADPTAATTPAAPGAAAPETRTGERAGAVVEVRAARPVEVSLDLRAQAVGRPLVVHALRSLADDAPRLRDVGVEASSPDEPPRVRVQVPSGQPPGVYSGAIVDAETSRAWGTLSVRVLDEPAG